MFVSSIYISFFSEVSIKSYDVLSNHMRLYKANLRLKFTAKYLIVNESKT